MPHAPRRAATPLEACRLLARLNVSLLVPSAGSALAPLGGEIAPLGSELEPFGADVARFGADVARGARTRAHAVGVASYDEQRATIVHEIDAGVQMRTFRRVAASPRT